MSDLRGFKPVFATIGVLYVLMAGSMLLRGPSVLGDFGIGEPVLSSPVLGDFFMFFYAFMAFVGVLMLLFAFVTHGAAAQTSVSAVFCGWCIVALLRDLSTSDSRFGNHLYKGDATLVFVYVGLAFTLAFAALVVAGLLRYLPKTSSRSPSA